MEEMEKFMSALMEVIKLIYPNFVVEDKRIGRIEHSNGSVDCEYELSGFDAESMLNVSIVSRGFILEGKGQQIEIYENGIVRYFPFYGINWKYLMA